MVTSANYPQITRSALCALALAVSGAAQAATIDFSNGGTGGGYGNTLAFSGGGITVNAYAWAETGAPQTSTPTNYWYFQTAEVSSFSTGLGICNRVEGQIGLSCDTNEHEIDTVGRDDLLVLYFDQLVSFEQLDILVDPWDGPGSDPNDRDIRYSIATVSSAPNLSTYSFATLSTAFGPSYLSAASSSYNAFNHVLPTPMTGNLLLLSGNFIDRNCTASDISGDIECEAWKLKSIMVRPVEKVVPVPAAVWLLGSALGVLGWLRRRSA
jgi:hypothetical protein